MDAKKDGFSTFINWFAWSVSLVASAFYFAYDLIPSIPDILSGKDKAMVAFFPWLLIAIIGCIASLFRQMKGALIMFVGSIGMAVDLYLHGGPKMAGMIIAYCGPYLLAALLLAISKKRA